MFSERLFEEYEKYACTDISSRRMRHAELSRHLAHFAPRLAGIAKIEEIGTSAEGRVIRTVTLGTGKTSVLMWSQMHGDEPTATLAICDILSFLVARPPFLEIEAILENLTIRILPMLNPDGAERFQRRTAQGVDLNRDACALQTPEARILKGVRDAFAPEFGFNLHDQDPRYTAGETSNVAAIALLAPPYDGAKSMNPTRERAKLLAAEIAVLLGQFVPDCVSRYDDEYEPRSFGDMMQKLGTSTVLIESGGWPGDPEKRFVRKLNFVVLLGALHAIAMQKYESAPISAYESLPENSKCLYDVIVDGATLRFPGGVPAVKADIGVNYEEICDEKNGQIRRVGQIVEIGDLREYHAFERIDARLRTLDAQDVTIDELIDVDGLRERLR